MSLSRPGLNRVPEISPGACLDRGPDQGLGFGMEVALDVKLLLKEVLSLKHDLKGIEVLIVAAKLMM